MRMIELPGHNGWNYEETRFISERVNVLTKHQKQRWVEQLKHYIKGTITGGELDYIVIAGHLPINDGADDPNQRPLTLTILRTCIVILEQEWGKKPIIILSCAGGTDEHWQIWHPEDCLGDWPGTEGFPHIVIGLDNEIRKHPDSDR